MTMRATVYSRI